VRCLDGLRISLGLLVLGQCPVDAGEAGALSLAAAGGDEEVRLDVAFTFVRLSLTNGRSVET
jgi:hypothetical protein